MTKSQVVQRKGGRLFGYYPSLPAALASVYPEYPWDASKFVGADKHPRGYWGLVSNQKDFLDRVAQQLDIQQVPLFVI